jgi:hypothetical protein
VEPDEEVAGLLEAAAQRIGERGDYLGAVAMLTRAADLSPGPAERNRRLAHPDAVAVCAPLGLPAAAILPHELT